MGRKLMLTALFVALLGVLIVGPAAQPAAAQGSTWYAEYYNNATLSGTPAITRYENQLAFNWGTGSPGSGINNDGFSARFATDVSLNPGTYRFFLQADDNARVTFNFSQVVIDTFTTPAVAQTVTGDVTVPSAGVYHIQIDYREVDSLAFLNFSYANAATNPQPNFPVAPIFPGAPAGNPVALTAPWTAQYYSNNSLVEPAAAIITIPAVSFNYGAAAPLPSVPVDNWSGRFTSVQSLSGGVYTLAVNADDGVRVYVNGALVINQIGGATGQTYTAQLTLPGGSNNFQVEYVEYSGNSFLNFALLTPAPAVVPTVPGVPSSPTGATALVTAYRLNVRQYPDPLSMRLAQINRNETYAVLGRNGDGSWYLLQVGSTQGWASSRFLTIQNGAAVPVVGNTAGSGSPAPTSVPSVSTGITVVANPYTVNIRSSPSTTSSRIGRLPTGQSAQLIGRNSLNQWWQINYNGIVGWVTAQYTVISPSNANINSVPVTG
ncbi:MAG: PA14 domain-containing protein [Anaerolineae bacterium]